MTDSLFLLIAIDTTSLPPLNESLRVKFFPRQCWLASTFICKVLSGILSLIISLRIAWGFSKVGTGYQGSLALDSKKALWSLVH